MGKTTFNRQELYELVWSEPLIRLSKKYNISDNGLRKICIRMNIPLPNIGHWQKIKFNKTVRKIKLPEEFSGPSEVTLIERDKNPKIDIHTS